MGQDWSIITILTLELEHMGIGISRLHNSS